MNRLLFFLLAIAIITIHRSSAEDLKTPPIALQDQSLILKFDSQTGGWTSLIDRKTGINLFAPTDQPAMVNALTPQKLDEAALNREIASHQAEDIESPWFFAQDRPAGGVNASILRGDYTGVSWLPTPVPSILGSGDDRLHNKIGDFWYRTEFSCPSNWANQNLTLIIGAIDDYDVTYVNGVEIGATGMGTPFHWETPRIYRIPANIIHRGSPNQLLIKVTNAAFDGGITSGPVIVGLSSALVNPEVRFPMLESHSIQRATDRTILQMNAQGDGYGYQYRYTLWNKSCLMSRQLTIRNISKKVRPLNGIEASIPPLMVGRNQSVIFPGTLPVGDNPVADIPNGATLSPRSLDPLAIVWDRTSQLGVGSWYDCEQEYSPVSVHRDGKYVIISHSQQIIALLEPGQSVTLGEQFLWVSHGSLDTALQGVQKVYRVIGLHAPSHHLPHLERDILYCGHPGGTPEMNFIGYGGFQAVDGYLPTLKKMGISLLWLLPIWDHGTNPRWNLYAPFDQYKVSSLYGTSSQLTALSKDAENDGIGLVFDLVPHGPPDFTPLAKEHPEWICRNEDGSLHYAWGQVSFDYAEPGWQDYMRGAAELDARKYNAVGARVDCGSGSPPNWNPDTGYRPSFSTLGGALEMNQAIRDGFLAVNHTALLMPEDYSGANILYRSADLTYDSQLYFLMMDLQTRNASPELWASSLRRFLHDQKLTSPPGALKMRWVSNHDTVAGVFQKARPAKVYGVPKLRALWALCAFIPGVPMLYQGDENPAIYGGKGVSSVDYLARIYGLRNRVSALSLGAARYYQIDATGGVFSCLREHGRQQAIVLISFNNNSINSGIVTPTSLSGKWVDALSGETFKAGKNFTLNFTPYQVRVLLRENHY